MSRTFSEITYSKVRHPHCELIPKQKSNLALLLDFVPIVPATCRCIYMDVPDIPQTSPVHLTTSLPWPFTLHNMCFPS